MSRICVKNLPKHVVEDRLREHFSRKGEVTDAKLMRTRDGKTRQFAFIGYQTEQEAEEAIKYFNNSYMDTFRITCETAYKFNDPNLRMPWSRHSAKKQEAMEKEKNKLNSVPMSKSELKKAKKKKKNKENVVVADPLLQEFLQVTQPRSKSKLWANDTTPIDQMGKAIGKAEVQLAKRDEKETGPVHDGLEGNEEEENVFVKKSLEKRSKPEDVVIARDEVLSDMDYLKSRIKKDWSDSEDEEDGSLSEGSVGQVVGEVDVDEPGEGDLFQVEGDADEPVEQNENESGESENVSDVSKQVLETGRLFVRNLPYTASEDDLADHFSKFGNLSQVHLVLDKGTKRSKGIAYVLYELPESALRALEELDNSTFQGRLLHIMPALQPISSEKQKASAASIQASKSFKQQREDRRKASEAGGDTRAWNSLFMRPDTVVEHVARKYGVSKSELLDREGDDLAVRIALGETQVIAETKKALENSGVNVAALEELTSGKTDTLKRSTHVILVKNLPYGSSEGDLADMFGKFGSLDKIVLPSTKTLALVVFLEPAEARAAFRGLAYKRYKDAPLYLEWAPNNILSSTSKSEKDAKNNDVGEQEVKRVLLEQRVEEISEVDFDPDRVESRSLFVKNLNFKTSDESLRKHFSEHMKEGSICSAKVKKHVKNGKSVSMGFGFVEFDSVETAKNVCRDMQCMILDGHALILQLCHAKKDEHMQKKVDKDKSTTKLIVRNVAFEATEKDLRQLFMPFGQVKSLRLPMKFGNHRGFAFVEFVTKQEAQNALRALSNTHLYGRHLVLERAKEGESLEELRARTASQFTNEENGFQNPIKLSKKRKQLDILDESNVKFSRIAG